MVARQKKDASSTNFTMRMDVKTRFTLELLSRHQHRSTAAVISWLAEREAKDTLTREIWTNTGQIEKSLAEVCWSPYEWERLIKMAVYCPELMSYEEELIWGVIRTAPHLWGTDAMLEDQQTYLPIMNPHQVSMQGGKAIVRTPDIYKIKTLWEMIKSVAEGTTSEEALALKTLEMDDGIAF